MSKCGKTTAGGWHCAGTNCAQSGRVCLLDVADPSPAPDRLLRPLTISEELIRGPIGCWPPLTFQPPPPAPVIDLARVLELIRSVEPVEHREVHGGRAAVTELFRRYAPDGGRPAALIDARDSFMGIPMFVDETLPPNVVEFRGEDGRLLSRFVVPAEAASG